MTKEERKEAESFLTQHDKVGLALLKQGRVSDYKVGRQETLKIVEVLLAGGYLQAVDNKITSTMSDQLEWLVKHAVAVRHQLNSAVMKEAKDNYDKELTELYARYESCRERKA